MALCEGVATAGIHRLVTTNARASDDTRAEALQAVTVIAGSAIELAAEYTREGLLRYIAQVHRDIKNRALGRS